MLLARGGKPNPRNAKKSALHFAVCPECLETVQILLKAGADPNAVNEAGETPLLLATEYKLKALMATLLEAGADANITSKNGVSPLKSAISVQDLELARLLLASGAAVNPGEANGVLKGSDKHPTPLMLACQSGNGDLTRIFIEAGANLNAVRDGDTPLKSAVKAGHVHIVRQLVEAGVNINLKTKGKTARDLAVAAKKVEILAIFDAGDKN